MVRIAAETSLRSIEWLYSSTAQQVQPHHRKTSVSDLAVRFATAEDTREPTDHCGTCNSRQLKTQ